MLVDIPEDFIEDFMQMLVEQLHEKTLDASNARVDAWDTLAKLKEFEKMQNEIEFLRQLNENQAKIIRKYMTAENKKTSAKPKNKRGRARAI